MSQISPPSPVTVNGSVRAYSVVTSLAAAFNLLILLVICFVVMPMMEQSIRESERNREAIRENRNLLRGNLQELEEYRHSLRRFNTLLDAAETRQKALKAAEKPKK